MTLEKINDDLIDFLPYEIDDSYIKKLFLDITNLKIKSKSYIPFYENIEDEDEIVIDQKGPAILKEMVEYYYDKDKNLTINTDILLEYFRCYAVDFDVKLKSRNASKFIEEFNNQNGCSNYLSYIKYKIERMQLKRFTDPNFLYYEFRKLSYFEEYLLDIIELNLESDEKKYNNILDFAEKLTKHKNNIFKEKNEDYQNKLYELKQIFANFNKEHYSLAEMKRLYGALYSIRRSDFISFLYLIKDDGNLSDSERDHYEEAIKIFEGIKNRLFYKKVIVDENNYKDILKEIEDEYGIGYDGFCRFGHLFQGLERKIRTYAREEREIKRDLEALNVMKEFILSGQPMCDYCKSKGIGKNTFYRYKDRLYSMKENDLGSVVDFIISKNSGGNVLNLSQIVDDTINMISDKSTKFDMLEYSLQSRFSLKEVAAIARGLKKDKESEVIDAYIEENKDYFETYCKDKYVGKINLNGRTFGVEEEKQLERYFKKEKLPSLVGIAVSVIYKILNNEELPSKNYQSEKKYMK